MRITQVPVIIAITVLVMILFSFINPVHSYQFRQNPQGINQVNPSINSRALIALGGCNGAQHAQAYLVKALRYLDEVSKDGMHLKNAQNLTSNALKEVRIHLEGGCRI